MKTRMPRRHSSHGFSLVELMIAVVLGLLILAGVTSVFLGTRAAFRTQESSSQVQESGRFLSYVLYPYIRTAGHLSRPQEQLDPRLIFRRSTNAAQNMSAGDPAPGTDVRRSLWGLDDVGAAANAAGVVARAGTDVVVTRYLGKNTAVALGLPSADDDAMLTCRGGPGGAGLAANQMAENVFFVSPPERAGEVGSLSCRASFYTINVATGAAGARQLIGTEPLLNGVQDMQILYGVDTGGDAAIDRYFAANNVPDWSRVVAVRITTTMQSAEQTEGADDDLVEDRRVVRDFSTTIQIRNRLRL